MPDAEVARAIHVVAVILWIGGVGFVTLCLLPYCRTEVAYWWMHAMVLVWLAFVMAVFVAEPLFLHRWFSDRAARDPEGTLRLVWRLHMIFLAASLVAASGAVFGVHG